MEPLCSYSVLVRIIFVRYQVSGITRGASPRRADARLGSTRALNYRASRQIEAVNASVRSAKGYMKNESRLGGERES